MREIAPRHLILRRQRAHFLSAEATERVDNPYARPMEHFDIYPTRPLADNQKVAERCFTPQ